VRRLLVTASVVPSSPVFAALVKEALSFSETSAPTRATRPNIPEDTILHSHRSENLKPYIIFLSSFEKFRPLQWCHAGCIAVVRFSSGVRNLLLSTAFRPDMRLIRPRISHWLRREDYHSSPPTAGVKNVESTVLLFWLNGILYNKLRTKKTSILPFLLDILVAESVQTISIVQHCMLEATVVWTLRISDVVSFLHPYTGVLSYRICSKRKVWQIMTGRSQVWNKPTNSVKGLKDFISSLWCYLQR
jgi:hypothetical protein